MPASSRMETEHCCRYDRFPVGPMGQNIGFILKAQAINTTQKQQAATVRSKGCLSANNVHGLRTLVSCCFGLAEQQLIISTTLGNVTKRISHQKMPLVVCPFWNRMLVLVIQTMYTPSSSAGSVSQVFSSQTGGHLVYLLNTV